MNPQVERGCLLPGQDVPSAVEVWPYRRNVLEEATRVLVITSYTVVQTSKLRLTLALFSIERPGREGKRWLLTTSQSKKGERKHRFWLTIRCVVQIWECRKGDVEGEWY